MVKLRDRSGKIGETLERRPGDMLCVREYEEEY